jgi:GMP synthase-like glutamine amidotransferase
MTRVGIIETGRPSSATAEQYGDFPKMFREYFVRQSDLEFETFSLIDGIPLPDPSRCGAWIITGSNHNVDDDLDWISDLRRFIQCAIAESVPLLGICFGHQLMADALGGKVEQSPLGIGIGNHLYTLNAPGEKVFGESEQLSLPAAHEWQVVEAPSSGRLLASSSFCKYAALSYGPHALSLQAHPEFTVELEHHLIRDLRASDPIDDHVVEDALKSLEAIRSDAKSIEPVLARFLKGEPLPD